MSDDTHVITSGAQTEQRSGANVYAATCACGWGFSQRFTPGDHQGFSRAKKRTQEEARKHVASRARDAERWPS